MHSTLVRIGYTPQSAVNRQIKDGSRFDSLFPKHEGKKELLKKDGEVDDTIEFMKDIVQTYNYQTKKIAQKLKVDSQYETCRRIWQFVVDYIKYNIEKGEQLRTPSQTWYDAQIMHRQHPEIAHYSADCDCMSIFVGCILLNLGIPFTFRVAGYYDMLGFCRGFQHVYVIAHCDCGKVKIDPVYHKFDEEKEPAEYRDYTMSLNGCDIYRLSGLGEVYYEDEFGRLNGRKKRKERKAKRKEKKAKRKAARKEKKAAKKAIKKARKSGDKEALKAAKARKKAAKKIIKENRTGIAKGMQKVGQGVAKAAKATVKFIKNTTMLVPRSMFNLLLRLNFRGMATKFSNNPDAYSRFLKTWKKVFGGKEKKLKKAIERGKNRKALFGKKKGVGKLTLNDEYIAIAGYLQGLPVFDKIKAKMRRLFKRDRELNGCDCISNEIGSIDGLGFAATAAVSSAVASATPIIKKAIDIFKKVNDMIPESAKEALRQGLSPQEVDEDEAINYESEEYEDEDDAED